MPSRPVVLVGFDAGILDIMAVHDVTGVLKGLEVTLRPGRYRFEKSDDPQRRLSAVAVITEAEGVTIIDEDDGGEWAWLTIAVETTLELVGLTATLAPALAAAGLPANILAGFHHDHILVPHDQAQHAVATLEALRANVVGRPYVATRVERDVPVETLTAASRVLSLLLAPEMGPLLTILQDAGADGCTHRELLDGTAGEQRVVLSLRAALIDAGLVEVVDGRTRLTAGRPPQITTALRELAAGPLRVPKDLDSYVDNGRIARYPKNSDDVDALLAHVIDFIGAGTVHSEASLTAALAPIAEPAELRRRLVDSGLVERTSSGSRYVVRARV